MKDAVRLEASAALFLPPHATAHRCRLCGAADQGAIQAEKKNSKKNLFYFFPASLDNPGLCMGPGSDEGCREGSGGASSIAARSHACWLPSEAARGGREESGLGAKTRFPPPRSGVQSFRQIISPPCMPQLFR